MGDRALAHPVGFFLHPKYAQDDGKFKFILTIDWKAVLCGEVSGDHMKEADLDALLLKLNVKPESKRAKDIYRHQEENKSETESKYIFKPCLRAVASEIEYVEESKEEGKREPQRYNLNVD